MSVEWVPVTPGRVEIGSDNRSILFGGVGPKHMVQINYRYSITKLPVLIEKAEKLMQSKEADLASESEWQLALDQGAITGDGELEKLSDCCKGDYWGKALDGRPHFSDDWTFHIAKKWSSGKPKMRLLAKDSTEAKFTRLVKREDSVDLDISPERLPANRDTKSLLREEILIALMVGIIPSFVWAYFNASEGYIQTGWPGLVLGGIILGLSSMLFWRPKTVSFRLGRNCGKVKEN